jgi:hypothetical protein
LVASEVGAELGSIFEGRIQNVWVHFLKNHKNKLLLLTYYEGGLNIDFARSSCIDYCGNFRFLRKDAKVVDVEVKGIIQLKIGDFRLS